MFSGAEGGACVAAAANPRIGTVDCAAFGAAAPRAGGVALVVPVVVVVGPGVVDVGTDCVASDGVVVVVCGALSTGLLVVDVPVDPLLDVSARVVVVVPRGSVVGTLPDEPDDGGCVVVGVLEDGGALVVADGVVSFGVSVAVGLAEEVGAVDAFVLPEDDPPVSIEPLSALPSGSAVAVAAV
jgi:hypothetical protein